MRNRTGLLLVGLLAVAGCEADQELFEETDATLAPPAEIEAARENPVDPTGEALGDGAVSGTEVDTIRGPEDLPEGALPGTPR